MGQGIEGLTARAFTAGGLASAFVAYRIAQATKVGPMEWQDSADYHRLAAAPGWFAPDVWIGERPPLVPFMLKVLNTSDHYVLAQTLASAGCWLLLAWAFSRLVRPGWARIAVMAAVLGMGVSRPIVQWDTSVLGESVSIGSAVLLLAALMHLARTRSWWSVAGVLGASIVFATARDTHVVVLALIAFAVLGAVLVRFWNDREIGPRLTVLGCGLALVTVVAWVGVLVADRAGDVHMANVMATRILPYPERLDWFAERGMPQADELRALDVPVIEDLGIRHLWIDPKDPQWAEYGAWINSEASKLYTRWLITHPGYVLSEPLKSPERATNNAHGDLSFYAAPDRDDVPLVTGLLFPAWGWLVGIGAAGAALAILGHRWPTEALVLAGMVPLGLVHMLVAWHAEGMETMRHALVGNVQARLGVLGLATIGVATAGRWVRGRVAHRWAR